MGRRGLSLGPRHHARRPSPHPVLHRRWRPHAQGQAPGHRREIARRVEDGELVNDGEGPFATTDRDYGDIELLVEYRTVAKADSGIYLRGNPQVQIWDFTKEGGKWTMGADKGSGGLWNNSPGAAGKDPLVRADRPFGEWNALRILQVGDKTTVYLNGTLVVDHATMENFWDRKEPLWARGPIQ